MWESFIGLNKVRLTQSYPKKPRTALRSTRRERCCYLSSLRSSLIGSRYSSMSFCFKGMW